MSDGEKTAGFVKRSQVVALSMMGVAAAGVGYGTVSNRATSCDRTFVTDSQQACVSAGGGALECGAALGQSTALARFGETAGVAVSRPARGAASARPIVLGADRIWRDPAGNAVVNRNVCRQAARAAGAGAFLGSRSNRSQTGTTVSRPSSSSSSVSRGGFGGSSRAISSSSSRGG